MILAHICRVGRKVTISNGDVACGRLVIQVYVLLPFNMFSQLEL